MLLLTWYLLSVEDRLKSSEGMSLTEFLYQCFQAYDWLHLYNTQKCLIQVFYCVCQQFKTYTMQHRDCIMGTEYMYKLSGAFGNIVLSFLPKKFFYVAHVRSS